MFTIQHINSLSELELLASNYLESDSRKKNLLQNKEEEITRKYFVEKRFPLEKVRTMGIDDYVEGKKETYEDSFCNILEFRLQKLGQIRGSYVNAKFVIHFQKIREIMFIKKVANLVKMRMKYLTMFVLK